MTKLKFELTEDQRSILTHALYVAATRFEENAGTAKGLETHEDVRRNLADQFTKQALDTRALADRIDNAEYIEIGPDTPDDPMPVIVELDPPRKSLAELATDFGANLTEDSRDTA